jgi:hypothetical protein
LARRGHSCSDPRVPVFLTDEEYTILTSVCSRLIPSEDGPGATEAGVVDYIDTLLGAFSYDPPRIWAAGPYSGRHGGDPGFAEFLTLSPLEELAWRSRIEGSLGLAEREVNGPVVGLQQRYREGVAALGSGFPELSPSEQDAALHAHAEFAALVFEHACEGMYGAPEYGGNRDLVGWRLIDFAGDVQPRGYTDAEVSEP